MLVMEARGLGIPCSGGLPMLVAQATRAAELFTGRADLQVHTERIITELERDLQNIVLIGMPGSGKSSFGKKLAKKLSRTFVDLDKEIVGLVGKSIPDIFLQDGEPHFRALENQVAMEFGKQNSLVIATGGGILLNPTNAQALKQNGKMIFVDRPLPSLATGGRPLSTGQAALEEMDKIRRPLYEKYQDAILLNKGPYIKVLMELEKLSK
jgi:shikimate dehydrogenase